MEDEDRKTLREMRQSTLIGKMHDGLSGFDWKLPIPTPIDDHYPTVITLLAYEYMRGRDPNVAELLCGLILAVGGDDYEALVMQFAVDNPNTITEINRTLGEDMP